MSDDEDLAKAKELGDELKRACRTYAEANDEQGTPFSRRWLDAEAECTRLCLEFGRLMIRRDKKPASDAPPVSDAPPP